MERSFREEVRSLRLGEGEVFHGEGILAVTKALLQSGVSYVSGYPGAPVSHLVDVLTDASDILDDLGVHFEPAGNEAGAAAMLGASINYPIRGAATWKSVVGTNVASDALSNLSSAGVMGGALIVVGEDYGEGASIIQERAHAFAMKSQVLAARSAPEPADHRRHGRARLCAVGGKLHAGDAGAAHPRLSRAWQLRVQGQPRAAAVAQESHRCAEVRLRAGLPAAVDLRPGEKQDRRALAGGRPLHLGAPPERGVCRRA